MGAQSGAERPERVVGRAELGDRARVSYPQPDHSHFRSMDIWQTASPAEPVATGWIGRWLDATGDDSLRAVSIGAVLPHSRSAKNARPPLFQCTAGPLFVAGTPVKGGFYGEEPSPTDLDNGDLKPNGLSRRLVRPAGAHHRHRSHTVGRAGRTSVGFLG